MTTETKTEEVEISAYEFRVDDVFVSDSDPVGERFFVRREVYAGPPPAEGTVADLETVDGHVRAVADADGVWFANNGEQYTMDEPGVRVLTLIPVPGNEDELVDSLSHALGETLPPETVAFISRNDRKAWVRRLLNHSQPNIVRSVFQILGVTTP